MLELLPHVRRTARLLVANPEHADQCVEIALEALVADGYPLRDVSATKIQLFSHLCCVWEALYQHPSPYFSRDGLKVAMQRMSPNDRLIIALTATEQLTSVEACILLRLNDQTFRRRQQCALARLREAMNGCVLFCEKPLDALSPKFDVSPPLGRPTLVQVVEPGELQDLTRLYLPNFFATRDERSASDDWLDALRKIGTWWPAPVVKV